MASVKEACKNSMQKLGKAAHLCDQFVKALIPKLHVVPAAKEAVDACKQVIEACREHVQKCKNATCTSLCQSTIQTAEKSVEKNTACIDACSGSSSDNDCKIVCKDAADASRACLKNCQDCVGKICS